jgi:GNAT superfamily N-acetyltransferase
LDLAAQSNLPTFSDPRCLKRYLAEEVVFGGFLRHRLVGCCCIEKNLRKKYLSSSGMEEFPLPNLYFCGAFVLPQYRKYGIGGKLYQHRLDYARAHFRATIIVELLGDGSPSSVDLGSMVGYRFYLKNGFKELGYSVDADAGKIVFLEMTGFLR